MNVTVVTDIPSPYQVELFNALEQRGKVAMRAVYVSAFDPSRSWKLPDITHQSYFIEDDSYAAQKSIQSSDLAVFSNYVEPAVRKWMQARASKKKPWVFWGERPGFRSSGLLGQCYRKVRLWPLHRSNVPIWGIGQWAVDRYQYEFGEERPYVNIPYYSNLKRFRTASPHETLDPSPRRILYAGSLSERKGVDLLARAFAEIATQQPALHLDVAGDGALRDKMETILSPVSSQVTFHGFVEWDTLPSLHAAADVLCVPSRYDGWALVVPEGLAAGLPVIATDRMGAALDLIRPSVNGWRVLADSQEALHRALQEASSLSEEQLSEMGQTAQREIFETHTLQHGAEKFEHAARQAYEAF